MTPLHRPARFALAAAALVVAALAASPAIAADHDVSIVGLSFKPAQISIEPGDTVTWTVTQSVGAPHSVTSGKFGDPDVGSAFDSGTSGLTNNGDTYQHTFDTAGVYDYYCTIHGAAMSGQVIVGSPTESAPAAEPPPSEVETGVPVERRAIGAGILAATLVILFAAAWLWRRVNPA